MSPTKIEWSQETWNPVTGCDRVSPGCDSCYALTMAARLKAMGQAKYQSDGDPKTSGPGFGVTCHDDELLRPHTWGRPRMVFVNSMSDLFHPQVPDEFIAQVFARMTTGAGRRHTYQVLTKRAQRMREWVTTWLAGWGGPGRWDHIWLGTSVENQRYLFRAEHLLRTPAATRFLSLEPLLGPLDLTDTLAGWCPRHTTAHHRCRADSCDGRHAISWVIVGGESGPEARPLHLAWIRDIRDQCATAGVPLFVKQLGTAWAREHGHHRDPKGGHWETWPADLRIREMP